MTTGSFTTVGKMIETLLHNFVDLISLYQNQIQQLLQEVKEMYTHHEHQSTRPRAQSDQQSVRPRAQSDHQDLINTYAEYIAELDEFFNYPNSRGDYE